MPRVLMNFQHCRTWTCHFIEADCKTPIGGKTRFFDFDTLEDLRAILLRANAEAATLAEFDLDVCRWARGSVFLNLSDEQYCKLKR